MGPVFPDCPSVSYDYDYGNIFSKSTTNMDENKKKNFRMEIDKKRFDFRKDSIYRVEIYLPLMFRTCKVETVKLGISLFLLLPNLFLGGQCFGKNSLST